jgi:UDP-N-acetylmuramoyl-tripeptide--D-alanyl-D-alanine ligase
MDEMLTLDNIIRALGGRARTSAGLTVQVSEVVVDSRLARPGSLFVALRGEQVDGHLYVTDALSRGAIAAIVERETSCEAVLDLRAPEGAADELGPLPVCLLVRDALAALQQLAAWWRAQFDVRIIGITGSIGKTTTKEYVASVLGQRYAVLKSEGNYNNEIGLPLTLLRLGPEHERVVLEMGTYGPGEITLLTDIAQPQVGVVTNVGHVHLERMGTLERIAEAKSELPRALPADGTAILNADDARVHRMAGVTQAHVFTYGMSAGSDLWADQVESHGLEGVRCRFHYKGPQGREQTMHTHLPLVGWHSVQTALRAAAVGLVEGLSWDEILNGLCAGEPLRLLAVPGIHGSTLLNDTYNSSPDSAVAALDLLAELEGRKIGVLGDMLELGRYEVEGHLRVGQHAMEVVSMLVTVGERGRLIGDSAIDAGMAPDRVTQVTDNATAIACLREMIRPGDVVLIKGSRGVAMEEIVEALAHPPAKGKGKGNGSEGQPTSPIGDPRPGSVGISFSLH